MSTKLTIPTNAAGVVLPNPISSGYYNTVVIASGQNGTVTGGTLSIECRAPGGSTFETPSVSDISLASPERIEIQGKIEAYSFTVTAFTGTATELAIAFDSYGTGTR